MLPIGTLLKLPSLTARFVPFEGKRSHCSYDTTYKSLDVHTRERGRDARGRARHSLMMRVPTTKKDKQKGLAEKKGVDSFFGGYPDISGYLGSESGLNRN